MPSEVSTAATSFRASMLASEPAPTISSNSSVAVCKAVSARVRAAASRGDAPSRISRARCPAASAAGNRLAVVSSRASERNDAPRATACSAPPAATSCSRARIVFSSNAAAVIRSPLSMRISAARSLMGSRPGASSPSAALISRLAVRKVSSASSNRPSARRAAASSRGGATMSARHSPGQPTAKPVSTRAAQRVTTRGIRISPPNTCFRRSVP